MGTGNCSQANCLRSAGKREACTWRCTGHSARKLSSVHTDMLSYNKNNNNRKRETVYSMQQTADGMKGDREALEYRKHGAPTKGSRQQRTSQAGVGGPILEDTRSSTKRLSKERLGRRCAYAWGRGADREASNGRQGGGGRGGAGTALSRDRWSCLGCRGCSRTHAGDGELAGEVATTFEVARSVVQSV
jgi:hypothetical protein